jgi:hypothetical protein
MHCYGLSRFSTVLDFSFVYSALYFFGFLQVDTNLESPSDIVPEGVPFTGSRYRIAPYSSILLKAKP